MAGNVLRADSSIRQQSKIIKRDSHSGLVRDGEFPHSARLDEISSDISPPCQKLSLGGHEGDFALLHDKAMCSLQCITTSQYLIRG